MANEGRFRIEVLPKAEKDLDDLKSNRDAAVNELLKLERDPHLGVPLKGSLRGARKLSFNLKGGGAYRAAYAILDDERVCIIFIVGSRENFYAQAERRWKSARTSL